MMDFELSGYLLMVFPIMKYTVAINFMLDDLVSA